MRTLLLLGVATGSLLLAGNARAGEQRVETVTTQHQVLDYDAPYGGDTRVYTGGADRMPSEGEYRRTRHYDTQGRWTGTWNGTYENSRGEHYQGTYEGRYDGSVGTDYPQPGYDPYPDGYRGDDYRYEQDMARRCGSGNSVGGAIVGGLIGGVAGNRIAGHGDRAIGTVIGGAAGAIAGGAIGHSIDQRQCAEWRARSDYYRQGAGQYGYGYGAGGYYGQGATVRQYAAPGYGYGYGYGYYSPGVVVVTTITSAPIVTETTTITTSYVNVPVRKRHHAAKKKRPVCVPKPRCAC